MIIATVKQARPMSFHTQDGYRVEVDAGCIVGLYYAVDHSGTRRPNPDRPRPQADRKHLEITFATADGSGDVYGYLSLLTMETLWPLEGETLRHDSKFFHFSEAGIRNVELDGSNLPPLRVKRPDGIVERHWSGPIRVGLDCRRKKWGLEARLNIHTGDPFDLNLAYKIPLERLLWRPYAVYTDDNVIGEAADFVWFKWIRKLSDLDIADGLCPGPIHVSPSATA